MESSRSSTTPRCSIASPPRRRRGWTPHSARSWRGRWWYRAQSSELQRAPPPAPRSMRAGRRRRGVAPGPHMTPPILTLRGISKRFGSVAALAGVDLDIVPGEVQAVLGENGAGKSTLMRVIYGLVAPDAGTMRLRGEPVRFGSALDARRAGIRMVHQEFALIDALSVAENLALSVCPSNRWLWRRTEVGAAAQRVADQIGLELGDLDTSVGALPVGVRQRIEIVKALAGETRVLILDEPTAVLTPREVEQLLAVLDRLRRAGTAVLFITHKLGEVMVIADRVTVMRGGRIAASAPRPDVSEAELARLMIGSHDTLGAAPPLAPPEPSARLELAHVRAADDTGLPALD